MKSKADRSEARNSVWLNIVADDEESNGNHYRARRSREIAEYIEMLEWTRVRITRWLARPLHIPDERIIDDAEAAYREEVQNDTDCRTVPRQPETEEPE